MTRSALVEKNRGVFGKIEDWAKSRQLGGRDRNGGLGMMAFASPFAAGGAAIGAGVAVAPVVAGAAAVAAGGYAIYKMQLDKAVVSAALKMKDSVKTIFTKQAGSIKQKAEAEISPIQTARPAPRQEEANPLFDRMNKIVEAHNRGDKFDTQTGQPLGASPIETMKQQGISDEQISAWRDRAQGEKQTPVNSIEAFAAKGRESSVNLEGTVAGMKQQQRSLGLKG